MSELQVRVLPHTRLCVWFHSWCELYVDTLLLRRGPGPCCCKIRALQAWCISLRLRGLGVAHRAFFVSRSKCIVMVLLSHDPRSISHRAGVSFVGLFRDVT